MKIKKKKMFKCKHLAFAHFSTKTGDFFVEMEKYQYFATNIFQVRWSDNVETFHKEKSGVFEEKNRK